MIRRHTSRTATKMQSILVIPHVCMQVGWRLEGSRRSICCDLGPDPCSKQTVTCQLVHPNWIPRNVLLRCQGAGLKPEKSCMCHEYCMLATMRVLNMTKLMFKAKKGYLWKGRKREHTKQLGWCSSKHGIQLILMHFGFHDT